MSQLFSDRAVRLQLKTAILVALFKGVASVPAASDAGLLLENFESDQASNHWSFSNGAEFPGAQGSFSIEHDAAHSGKFGGQLNFDFTGGGNYVSALLHLPEPRPPTTTNWNALRLWLKRPAHSELTFRYTDSDGQTFQKPIACQADRWTQVTIPFLDWLGHWGGKNDGKVRGAPRILALNVDHGEKPVGQLQFDDLSLVHYQAVLDHVGYSAWQFEPAERWHLHSEGNAGGSRLQGKVCSLDFSAGARSLTLSVPDRVLLGNVDRIHVRAHGSAQGHPVRLVLRTHFMTFQKMIGEFSGQGEQEIITEGPPGPGWEWHSGENDGKLHGPLRLGEIQFLGNSRPDKCELELREVVIDASCPPEKGSVLWAECESGSDHPAFTARTRALSDHAISGELAWVLRDWGQKEVARGKTAVTIPAKTMPAEVKVPLTTNQLAGHKFLEAEFELTLPGQEVPPARAAWLAPMEHSGDSALDPGSPFGMGVYLNRYGSDAQGLAQMERAAQYARDAGVKWSREDFSWNRIERDRGNFDWTFYDNLLACAKRNGITVYAIAGYWSSWTKPYSPEGIEDYLNYLRAMVRHYQNDIKYWEIWNEPNIFFWQGPKEMYAQLLTKSYAAIKEVDPEARVLGLSTAGLDTKFIDRMLTLKTPFDILTIHPYRTKLDDWGFIGELKKVSAQVQLPDGRRRPVWLTEMGWATHTPHNTLGQDFAPTSLRSQAGLLARSYLCAIVSGVEPRTFWYDFRNDGDDPFYFEHQMGIVYSDFRPKPAYQAYATLTRVLKAKKPGGKLEVAPGVLAYEFKSEGNKARAIALWAPTGDVTIELPVKGARLMRVNTVGEESQLNAPGQKVRLELKAGAPEYILETE